jgi:hypothetical protein
MIRQEGDIKMHVRERGFEDSVEASGLRQFLMVTLLMTSGLQHRQQPTQIQTPKFSTAAVPLPSVSLFVAMTFLSPFKHPSLLCVDSLLLKFARAGPACVQSNCRRTSMHVVPSALLMVII